MGALAEKKRTVLLFIRCLTPHCLGGGLEPGGWPGGARNGGWFPDGVQQTMPPEAMSFLERCVLLPLRPRAAPGPCAVFEAMWIYLPGGARPRALQQGLFLLMQFYSGSYFDFGLFFKLFGIVAILASLPSGTRPGFFRKSLFFKCRLVFF